MGFDDAFVFVFCVLLFLSFTESNVTLPYPSLLNFTLSPQYASHTESRHSNPRDTFIPLLIPLYDNSEHEIITIPITERRLNR